MTDPSLETLTQLLMQPNALLLNTSPQQTLNNGFPVHLVDPLYPQIIQQQIFNYSLMQQLFTSMIQQSSIDALTSTLVKGREETTDQVGTSESKEIVIPNDDKEGWCRNKKYIEKVANGFMCLVCKKVYGRYNSVSYHVTIYHRNPPIKCDIEGCDFTTREARYIHFHKYYRHGIGLPRNIDQGSRRCPFCKHVSKSPAMLEKHMKRHSEGSVWPMRRIKKDSETVEEVMEEGRSRTFSECPSTTEMEVDDEPKPRSFTL